MVTGISETKKTYILNKLFFSKLFLFPVDDINIKK